MMEVEEQSQTQMNNDMDDMEQAEIIGSVQVPRTRKQRKKKSRCWKSFKKLPVGADGIELAKCTKCGAEYKCDLNTGTTSLIRHHDVCYASGNVVSPHSATRSSKFQHEKFTKLLIEAIIKHDLPFSFVEYEGIRAVFEYVSPTLKLPCRNTVKAHLLRLYEDEKSNIQNMLSCAKGRICLTSDLWSSQTTDGYLTLTAHFLDSEWKLHKKILSFSHMPPPHNGSALAEKINSLICEWEIDKNLFSITLDNASANDSFVEKLRNLLNFRGLLLLDGKFFHIRCCAHILNLIVQDGLKSIDESVVKIRDCLKYIKGSMSRKHRFIECIAQVGMGGSKRALRQDLPTRWNSTYIMLDSALHYRRALINFALIDSDFKCCPSYDEWEKIGTISKFLGYFYEVTCLFSGTKYSTANLFFPKVFVIQHSIQQARAHREDFMRRMGNEMSMKFDKYWADYSIVLGIAVVMDPRYKMDFVKWAYKKLYGENSDELKKFSDTLLSLFDVYVERWSNVDDTSCFMNEGCSQTEDEENILQDFDASYKNRSSSSMKTELDKYLDEERLDRRMELDVLSWWRMEQFRYPILSRLAGDVLTIPISTVASESAFSIAGRVLDQYRSSLLPETVQALLCTRDWLFGKSDGDKDDLEQLTEDVLDLTIDPRSQTN